MAMWPKLLARCKGWAQSRAGARDEVSVVRRGSTNEEWADSQRGARTIPAPQDMRELDENHLCGAVCELFADQGQHFFALGAY